MADLTNLDFTQLRAELKEYLKNQEEFTDYDFDGSGMSVLLDVLAYNTQMNAMLAHMNMNETFLDTAQVRSNVVSHAQNLGYRPKSNSSARAEIDITVQGTAESFAIGTIPRGYKLTGKINNKEYSFVTLNSYTATKLNDNTYNFFNVPVYQGDIKTITYRVDGLNPFAKYEIPSDKVDIEQITVRVYENPNSTFYKTYNVTANVTDIATDSEVYFYRENAFGRYEIYFGDDYLGKKPASGSKVEIQYLETLGSEANNIRELAPASPIQNSSNITVTLSDTYESTTLGASRESLESIRYNAPISFSTQNRAVTANDYRILLLQEFPDMVDVSVWGGEDNDPPIYGKVFISPVLKNYERATETFNDSLLLFLKGKNIGAITPEVIASEMTRLCFDIEYKYDTDKTSATVGDLNQKILDVVEAYDTDVLNRFTGVFRYSNLISKIDAADPGIISTVLRATMLKTFTPNPLIANDYTIKFPSRLYLTTTDENILTSNTFLLDGLNCRFGDEPIDGDETNRRLYVYNFNTGFKLDKYTDVGRIDPIAGTVQITNLKFDTSNLIEIRVKPDSFDISPKYNQLLRVCRQNLTITGELDTVSLLGSTGLSDYNTFSRHS